MMLLLMMRHGRSHGVRDLHIRARGRNITIVPTTISTVKLKILQNKIALKIYFSKIEISNLQDAVRAVPLIFWDPIRRYENQGEVLGSWAHHVAVLDDPDDHLAPDDLCFEDAAVSGRPVFHDIRATDDLANP